MKTVALTLVLAFSAFGRGCVHDPHSSDHGCAHEPPPVSDVPEPATFLLMGAGLIGTGILLRRKKKNTSN